jgi:hypothetical protein
MSEHYTTVESAHVYNGNQYNSITARDGDSIIS